ncbi:hypothetical protein [Sphingomonas soli]|uniref:hypothetical protein n=1 Tax=Sphingomonas soli TaxID=266127 RepID=UPI000829D711|nr:hypothetical protein [Sphingomonas soli]
MIPLGAALDFMRGKWWLLGVGAALIFALIQWGNARHWEKRYLQQVALIERAKVAAAEQYAANEKRLAEATADYAARAAAAEPIILHSRETVTRYAETPAGAAPCLATDRVDGVRRDREALFAGDDTSAAERGAGAVQALPAP